MRRRAGTLEAIGWVVAVVLGERAARRAMPSRSRALLLTYLTLGAASLLRGHHASTRNADASGSSVVAGLALTFGGYQLGRALLGDAAADPPAESFTADLASLGIVVPVAEEAIWGTRVEPVVGVTATAGTFAVKHALVDGRWRRGIGLAMFWTGLALVRRRSPAGALLAHVAANIGAVVIGHASARDRF